MLIENHDNDGIWKSYLSLNPTTSFCKLPTKLIQYVEITMNQII
jgi:hypothetical protein